MVGVALEHLINIRFVRPLHVQRSIYHTLFAKMASSSSPTSLTFASPYPHRSTKSTPIDTIPSDILDFVFSICVAAEPPISSASIHVSRSLGWIRLTHVCRMWRHTALHNPLLWTNLVLSLGPRWLEEGIKRAQAVPLLLDQPSSSASTRPRNLTGVLADALHHSHRIRTVHFDRAYQHSTALVPFLNTPAPALESLSLSTNDDPGWIYTLFLPARLFAGDAPRLCRIALTDYHFQWHSFAPLGASLTHLVLRRASPRQSASRTTVRPRDPADGRTSSWEEMIRTFDVLPNLEVLVLAHCLPTPSNVRTLDAPQAVAEDSGMARLPSLKKLVLEGGVDACARLLSHLEVPPSANVFLRCLTGVRGVVRHADELLPLLAQRAASPQSLELSFSISDREIMMSAWGERAAGEEGSNVSLGLVYGPPADDLDGPTLAALMKNMCREFCVTDMRAVAVDLKDVCPRPM
ncbi:hypothetical protein OF83DRAFT_21102 [Amylostereum chailletii]|nr:hypothetical protein OF83DRAFT_21102 [Amylostereum chailletii]